MAEQTARLKLGDNLFDKPRKGIRRATLDDKTVCGFFVEPLLQSVGNLLWRAAETRTRTCRFQSNLTKC